MKNCPQCGNTNLAKEKLCYKCGYRFPKIALPTTLLIILGVIGGLRGVVPHRPNLPAKPTSSPAVSEASPRRLSKINKYPEMEKMGSR